MSRPVAAWRRQPRGRKIAAVTLATAIAGAGLVAGLLPTGGLNGFKVIRNAACLGRGFGLFKDGKLKFQGCWHVETTATAAAQFGFTPSPVSGRLIAADGIYTQGLDPVTRDPIGSPHDVFGGAMPMGARVAGSGPPIVGYGCDTSGATKRVQVLYAYQSGTSNDLSTRLPTIVSSVNNIEQTFADSEAKQSVFAGRTPRWLVDGSCNLVVNAVAVSSAAMTDINQFFTELTSAGYSNPDRDYLAYLDTHGTTTGVCGVGALLNSDPDSLNTGTNHVSNHFAGLARTDDPCWNQRAPGVVEVMAHELGHNIGAVALNAPHTTGAGHCTDEYDTMCYSDPPSFPSMSFVCTPNTTYEQTYDCNNDDYYYAASGAANTTVLAPSGYLSNHWNSFNNCHLLNDPCFGVEPTTTTTAAPTTTTSTAPTTTTTAPPSALPPENVQLGGRFIPIRPIRVVDTRAASNNGVNAFSGTGPWTNGSTHTLHLAGPLGTSGYQYAPPDAYGLGLVITVFPEGAGGSGSLDCYPNTNPASPVIGWAAADGVESSYVVLPLGSGGNITCYDNGNNVDVMMVMTGYVLS